MQTTETIPELRAIIGAWRRGGHSIGFVPTMGNLHAGHVSLVALARQHSERVVVSVFVNPLQFGPGEDYERYPRTLDADSEQLRAAGAEVLFLPSPTAMYPPTGAAATYVDVPGLSEDLCGRFRPGHFRGVATVVCKLLNIIQPDCMILGEKDFQQLTLIQRMVRDLDLPVTVVAGPTVREASGLAMSSRNSYLSVTERDRAAALYRCLATAGDAVADALRPIAEAEREAWAALEQAGFRVDYVSVRRREDLALPAPDDRELIILAAAWLGGTRLIDNRKVDRNE
jgi:pantoate--beta-alanine ligase